MVKMQFIKTIFIILVTGLVINACDPEVEVLDETTFGYTYTPFELGKFWIYKTDSIYFSKEIVVTIDSVSVEIMEEVVDTFRNANNELVFSLDQYLRKDSSASWELVGNSFVTSSKSKLIKSEFGLDFIKLVYPVAKNKSWNGNVYIGSRQLITFQGEPFELFSYWNNNSYYYVDIKPKEMISSGSFENVLSVEEADYTDEIIKIKSNSKYADHIGLVYHEAWFLKRGFANPNTPYDPKAERGVIIRQYLIQHN